MKPKRADVYLLRKDQTGKTRPIVILSNDTLNGGHSVVAVPFYSHKFEKRSQQSWCAAFSAGEAGLDKDCVAKTDEISLLDNLHIDLASGPIGSLDDEQMDRVVAALKWSLGIS